MKRLRKVAKQAGNSQQKKAEMLIDYCVTRQSFQENPSNENREKLRKAAQLAGERQRQMANEIIR